MLSLPGGSRREVLLQKQTVNPEWCLLFCKAVSGQTTKRPPLTSRNKYGTGSPRRGMMGWFSFATGYRVLIYSKQDKTNKNKSNNPLQSALSLPGGSRREVWLLKQTVNPEWCLLFCKAVSGQITKRPPLSSWNKYGTGSSGRGMKSWFSFSQQI